MTRLLVEGKLAGAQDEMVSFDEFTTLMGLPDLRNREQRYLDAASELAGRRSAHSTPDGA